MLPYLQSNCLRLSGSTVYFHPSAVNKIADWSKIEDMPGNELIPDLILENAQVITCDRKQPLAEAVAVRDSRIWQVGTASEIRKLKRSRTRVIDCQGKTLVPGFIDAHCHFFSLVRRLLSLDLSPAAVHSISDIIEVVRRRAEITPEGQWIKGFGYNEFYLAEHRHPTRYDLDLAAPRHPVIITHRSLHASVLNSLALKLIGINIETEEPPGGMIDRDLETGEPDGILYEMQDYVNSRIPSHLSADELELGISLADRLYLSHGITSIGEATVTNNLRQWNTYSRLKSSTKIKSRISMMPGEASLNEFQAEGLITGTGDDHLRIGSLKFILSEARGCLQPSREYLNRRVLEASRAGFQVALHAVEQNTVAAAVSALEYLKKHNPQAVSRHRTEHCSECPPDLRRRLSAVQAVVVSQPPFIFYHGERYLSDVAPETREWLYPFKSILDAGIKLAAGSDSPVVAVNPLIGIYGAVTRLAETGQVVQPAEAVSVMQALEMYTLNAAYASCEEQDKGSITPGKLADMVLLSRNPLHVSPEMIKEIQVEMTVIGGRILWEK
jgi:predicted amidohydrolase YtcJ